MTSVTGLYIIPLWATDKLIGASMLTHFIAFITGVIVATVGFSGVANIADKGVEKVQTIVKEAQ